MIRFLQRLFRTKRKQIRLRNPSNGRFRKKTICDDPLVMQRIAQEGLPRFIKQRLV